MHTNQSATWVRRLHRQGIYIYIDRAGSKCVFPSSYHLRHSHSPCLRLSCSMLAYRPLRQRQRFCQPSLALAALLALSGKPSSSTSLMLAGFSCTGCHGDVTMPSRMSASQHVSEGCPLGRMCRQVHRCKGARCVTVYTKRERDRVQRRGYRQLGSDSHRQGRRLRRNTRKQKAPIKGERRTSRVSALRSARVLLM